MGWDGVGKGQEASQPAPGGGRSGAPGAQAGHHSSPFAQLRAARPQPGSTGHLFKSHRLASQQNKETVAAARYHIAFYLEKIKFSLFTEGARQESCEWQPFVCEQRWVDNKRLCSFTRYSCLKEAGLMRKVRMSDYIKNRSNSWPF